MTPTKLRIGRPPANPDLTARGILWKLRTGRPWRHVPSRFGKWNSLYRAYKRASGQ